MLRDALGEYLRFRGRHDELPARSTQDFKHFRHPRIRSVLENPLIAEIHAVGVHGAFRIRVAHAHSAPERVVQRRPDERPQRRRFRFQPETPQRIPHRIDDPRLRVRQRPVQIKEYCFVLHGSLVRPPRPLRNLGQGR